MSDPEFGLKFALALSNMAAKGAVEAAARNIPKIVDGAALAKPEKVPPSMAFWTKDGHVSRMYGQYPPNYNPRYHGFYDPSVRYNFPYAKSFWNLPLRELPSRIASYNLDPRFFGQAFRRMQTGSIKKWWASDPRVIMGLSLKSYLQIGFIMNLCFTYGIMYHAFVAPYHEAVFH